MLYNRQLAKYFGLVHFDEARIDFAPFWNTGNIIKNRRVRTQWTSLHLAK